MVVDDLLALFLCFGHGELVVCLLHGVECLCVSVYWCCHNSNDNNNNNDVFVDAHSDDDGDVAFAAKFNAVSKCCA